MRSQQGFRVRFALLCLGGHLPHGAGPPYSRGFGEAQVTRSDMFERRQHAEFSKEDDI